MILIHATALVGLILFPLPRWHVVLGAATIAWLGGIGTTVGYHRAIAHRALRPNSAVRAVLIFFAMFNGSGSPTTWAASHRVHHANADTLDDVSSPALHGFWWAHLRWLCDTAFGEDSSRNVRWLAFMHFFQGENWHRNHHARPGIARLGWTWHQPDVGYAVICFLEMIGLVSEVRRIRHVEL